jgi:hypothetical protein
MVVECRPPLEQGLLYGSAANNGEDNLGNEEITMNATQKSANDWRVDRPLLNVEPFAAGAPDSFVENLAADLTVVAYRVALRHGLGDQWLALQLDLWEALREAIEERSGSNLEIQLPYDPRLDVD